MTPERWSKVEELYHLARERGPGVLLDIDGELRREIEELLAHDSTGKILDRPAMELFAESTLTERPASGALSLIGQTVSHYRILARLGAGGMGVVYKAFDAKLNRLVALKFLPPVLSQHEDLKKRLIQEARAASALDHPNIVVIHDVDETPGGDLFVAMAFHDGVTLRDKIRGGLPAEEALRIARQIASGLSKAHEHGVFHRDIKPSNVIVAKDGVARIIDFGLARSIDATITADGSTRGTPLYMSPEQASGRPIDLRTDLWSLGAVLYEMLAGNPPFRGETHLQVMHAVIYDEVPRLRGVRPELPAEIDAIVSHALQKDVAKRYESAAAMVNDLSEALLVLGEVTPKHATLRNFFAVSSGLKRTARLLRLAMVAAAGFLLAAIWPVPPAGALKVTPFASEAEVETMPAWSPKGDRIAYIADTNGMLQVFTKALGLSTPTQMTHEHSWCYSPAWSDDGTHIYFLSAGGLHSVSVAGGQPQLVLNGFSKATVSPDGKSVAVLRRGTDGLNELAFSSPVGAPLRTYRHQQIANLDLEENASSFAFSRDSRYLGVISDNHGQPQFWKIPLADGAPERLAYPGRNFTFFAWLDRQRIVTAFIGSQYSPSFVSNLKAGTSYPLTTGSARDTYPALSPDSRTLAFSTGEAMYSIIEVPLDGSQPREVITSSRQAVAPSWAPDGTRFAYVTNRSGAAEVWLRNRVDGSERRIAGQNEVGGAENQFFDAAISPDGNRVAFRRWWGAQEIWISPLSGEPPVRLWNDPAKAPQRGPTWSPDGNWIAYYGVAERKYAILKIRIGANTPPEIVTYTSAAAPPQWSPRGDWIVFRDGSRMRMASPDGKQERVISQQRWETYGWSKDGATLYGVAADVSRHLILNRYDIASGSEKRITDLGLVPPGFELANSQGNFWYRGFSMHPDGKSFLTSVYRMQAHIWLMEDFDRPTRLLDLLWKKP